MTHVVTDKAKTMTEVYPMTQKWNLKVWTVEEFASNLLKYMYSKGTRVTSPTLQRLTTMKRDLSHCLQEEKRHSKTTKAVGTNVAAAATNTTTTTQYTNRPSSANENISFVPFETFYVMIEDLEGLHCPIFKEYPLQMVKDDSAHHFKVPRLPYPIFYWESPTGQCPFIPPLMNENGNNNAKRSSQHQNNKLVPVEDPKMIKNANTNEKENSNAEKEIVPDSTAGLRARALRNNSVAAAIGKGRGEATFQFRPLNRTGPNIVFEPAMTDTSILTAKTNLRRGGAAHIQQKHLNPSVKITPNISINVNRTAMTANTGTAATTPRNHIVGGQLRKTSPNLSRSIAPLNLANERKRAGEKVTTDKGTGKNGNVTAATTVHRPRPGFCECCCEKYSDLERHTKESIHRQFAVQSENYEGIDSFLSSLKRPFRSEYLISSYKADVSLLDEDSVLAQNSPISPSTTMSVVTSARNYTGTKKMKQTLASQRLKKMLADTTTSSILDDEETAASGKRNEPSSPSCKRRKSHKSVTLSVK